MAAAASPVWNAGYAEPVHSVSSLMGARGFIVVRISRGSSMIAKTTGRSRE